MNAAEQLRPRVLAVLVTVLAVSLLPAAAAQAAVKAETSPTYANLTVDSGGDELLLNAGQSPAR